MSFKDWMQYNQGGLPCPPLEPPPPPPPQILSSTTLGSVLPACIPLPQQMVPPPPFPSIPTPPPQQIRPPPPPQQILPTTPPQQNLSTPPQQNLSTTSKPKNKVGPHIVKNPVVYKMEEPNPNSGGNQSWQQKKKSNASKSNDQAQVKWILKPPLPPPMEPEDTTEMKEEKQRLWKEYRKAMKPYKNREFANAKRTVQRLSKRNLNEMDEKERDRLQRAEEFVSAHKTMLTQKSAMRSMRGNEKVEPGTSQGNTEKSKVQIYVQQRPPKPCKSKPIQCSNNNICPPPIVPNFQWGPTLPTIAVAPVYPVMANFIPGGFLQPGPQMR